MAHQNRLRVRPGVVSTTTAATLEDAGRPHLPISRILGYGAGDAGCNIAFQMTGLFLLVFYTDVVGIDPVHAGNIFLFVKIWDAFMSTYPLTEARFRQILESIYANRVQRVAQAEPDDVTGGRGVE